MKPNIKRAIKFSTPVVIFSIVLVSWIAGLKEGFVPGLIMGLFIGGLFALMIGFVNSETGKEGFADFRLDKEKSSRMKANFKKLFPNLSIVFICAVLTRFTGKKYLFFIMSVALCMAVTFLQAIKSGEYNKAKAKGELTAFYSLLLTLPVSLLSLFFLFLFLIYNGNVKAIFKLL